jgi:hypothetical protein
MRPFGWVMGADFVAIWSLSIKSLSPSCRTLSGIQRPLKRLDSGLRRNDDLFEKQQFINRLYLMVIPICTDEKSAWVDWFPFIQMIPSAAF